MAEDGFHNLAGPHVSAFVGFRTQLGDELYVKFSAGNQGDRIIRRQADRSADEYRRESHPRPTASLDLPISFSSQVVIPSAARNLAQQLLLSQSEILRFAQDDSEGLDDEGWAQSRHPLLQLRASDLPICRPA